ncbi:putative D-tyrosyl-tRNA(Tyr) deacylase 2 [Brachionus plicatilis]|uniref:D-aminoacyl-tRNA deacylase n=1 Tax=Brachionus plicatilis TaxID=10195 RepID=A0A3M7PFG2_BRAPC|nr:putative D-tyrosyl-tRNA(Tyr) deacylase 2 [Brachionus plicatilis]
MSELLRARCLVQQCVSARLQVVLPDIQKNILPEFVQIERGAVFFVCFMKDATEADVDKLAKSVLNVRLSQTEDSKSTSVLDLPGDILIIPQACLGGKMKGKMFQYHNNIGKDAGLDFYAKFVDLCKKYAAEHPVWSLNKNLKVLSGTYGIRQVYSTETNGPNMHLIEL